MIDDYDKADCPVCKLKDVAMRDGKLLRHNIPQHVPGPEEIEREHGGIFFFVKCDNREPNLN